jgi:hypothetical protein
MANLDAILRITAKGDASGLASVQAGLLSIEAAGKSASGAMGSLGSVVGAATGGVVALGAGLTAAGVASFTKNVIDAADNMRDLSQRTGVSVELLSKFQQQANMSGANIEDVGKAMVKLGKNMYEAAQTGKGPAAEALKELGLSATDATGRLVPTGEQMLRISDRLSELPDGGRKGKLAMDLMGKGAATLVPALNEGRGAIEGLNASFDKKFTDDADVYNDSVARLGETFQKFGVVLARQFLPILQSTVNGLTDLGVGLRILNLPFAGDKAAEIRSIKQEIISLREERAKFGQRDNTQSDNPEDDPVVKAVNAAKQKQEAFNAAIDQSNAQYKLLGATIDATAQTIQRVGNLRDAELNADLAVNNAAKSILEYKLGQAKTDAEKIPLLLQIKQIELENARIQKLALDDQIYQETLIVDLKRQKAWEELRSAQAALATAAAYGQSTAKLQEQVNLMKVAANSADTEYKFQQRIAAEKTRGAQASYDAQRQIIGMGINQIQSSSMTPTGRTFNGRPTYMQNGREMGATTHNGVVSYRPISYAGGGYTGNAPRSGGLDGQGGFMAMLHPRETVVDHMKTGAAGGVPNITIQTGPIYQLPDGTDTVSMADFHAGLQSVATGIMTQLRSPGGRMALRGA